MVYFDRGDSIGEVTKSSSEDGAGSAESGAATGAAERAITAKAAGAAAGAAATAATGGATDDSGKARVQYNPNETAAQSRASRPVDASRESCGTGLVV